ELLASNRERYAETLRTFLRFRTVLQEIPVHPPADPDMPYWLNVYFQGLDPVSLYAFASLHNPRWYVEIGSGTSTKFARKAIRDQGLRTRIISIDPRPRADVDG